MARLFPMLLMDTKTRNFTANTIFHVPVATSQITKLTGTGAPGLPVSYKVERYTQKFDANRQPVGAPFLSDTYPVAASTAAPEAYCTQNTGAGYECYSFFKTSNPGTTGAATTAFNRTFPGGVAGPATPVTYNDVPVAPGTTQALLVPSGGSVTVTYTE